MENTDSSGSGKRDGEDVHVIDVAKPRRLGLLGVMQPTCPVDGDICCARVEAFGRSWRWSAVALSGQGEQVRS